LHPRFHLDFDYLWFTNVGNHEEISIPIKYTADRAEQILLETAERHTVKIASMSQEALYKMQRRYFVQMEDLQPKVYYRITDNWLELTVRFVVKEHGIRDLKDAVSRDILTGFDQAGIDIASATFDIVVFPTLRVQDGSNHSARNSQ